MLSSYAIASTGKQISNSIIQSGIMISDAINRGFEQLSEAITVSGSMQANSIMKGSTLIFQGLQEIASEIERQAIISEVNSLTTRIREDEEWLFENKCLKEFYEKIDLNKVMYSHIKPMYLSFLDAICSHQPKKDYVDVMSVPKESNEALLKNYAMMYKCHPIIYLSAILVDRGMSIPEFREEPFDFDIWISGTGFCWENNELLEPYGLSKGEIKSIYELPYERAHKVGHETELRMDDRKIWFSDSPYVTFCDNREEVSHTKMDENLTVEYLQKMVTRYEETHPISEEETFKWLAFFNKLNAEISLENLRTLSQELSNFVRQKRIELS